MYYVCSPELGGNKEYIYIYILSNNNRTGCIETVKKSH